MHPYFNHDILAEMLVDDIWFAQKLKGFHIYGYKINPEHIHFMFRPGEEANYSQIMHSIKNNFSRNANYIMGYNAESKAASREASFVRHFKKIEKYRDRFVNQHGARGVIPKFDWQSSFHDHFIRNERDFDAHINYIKNQWIKHNLPEDKYCYILKEKPLIYSGKPK